MPAASLDDFYHNLATAAGQPLSALLPKGLHQDIGHFNVFNIEELLRHATERPAMTFDRRAYYKISLICGRNRAEYADKVIDIEQYALVFTTPQVPYHWVPQGGPQAGYLCLFTADFMLPAKSGVVLPELPIFQVGGYPVFQLTAAEYAELEAQFAKMAREIDSSYPYKYDLLRAQLLELIHAGQKLQPAAAQPAGPNAAARVSALFIELLERQFPIEAPPQRLPLRTARDYAQRLGVHANHLNRVLKETTGHTTTDLISQRLILEAKVLLKQTSWTVSEIADSLGFGEVAHFSNFFKRRTSLSPLAFRG